MEKKIAFISDVHGNIFALKKVLSDIKSRNIEQIYSLGDFSSYGSSTAQIVDMFLENNIVTVLGNNDNMLETYLNTERQKNYIKSLKEIISIEFNGKKILLTHGSPFSIYEYVYKWDDKLQHKIAKAIDEDIIVFGHTHIAYKKEVLGKFFLNPGSVGRPKDGDIRASYAILTIDDDLIDAQFIRLDYDKK